MKGQCQCGAIKFETPLTAPVEVYVCHCTECQHQSSSAFGISAKFPRFDVSGHEVGDISKYTRETLSGRKLDCLFCAKCGSRLIHQVEGEDAVMVKGGCLANLRVDDAIHIWCKEAIIKIPDGVKAFAEEPDSS